MYYNEDAPTLRECMADEYERPLCDGNGEVHVHCGHYGTDPDCTCYEEECLGCENCGVFEVPEDQLDPERFVPEALYYADNA